MEHFQINPVFVIGHPEEITPVFIFVDKTAGVSAFFPYLRGRLSVFLKIIPKYPPHKPHIKAVKFWQNNIQRFLQIFFLDIFIETHKNTVHIAHALPGNHRKEMGGVIQLVPADVFICTVAVFSFQGFFIFTALFFLRLLF